MTLATHSYGHVLSRRMRKIALVRGEMWVMAGPPELLKVVSEAVGMPVSTLVVYDRALMEAGLRSKHGRGRAAAVVTPRDAAHLLTAILASPMVKDSVPSVERYAATKPRQKLGDHGGFEVLDIPELSALTEASSFLDGLEALIAAVASGSLREALALPKADANRPLLDVAPLITVMATTPATIGEIRLGGVRRKTAAVLYTLPGPTGTDDADPQEAARFAAAVDQYRTDTDLEQQRRIATRTIIRVGELLAPTRRAV